MNITIDKNEKHPIYMQIYRQIKCAIYAGDLPAGTLLLPERKLAVKLSVNRSTVLNAYNRLKEEGLIDSKVGQGTIVAAVNIQSDSSEPSWNQLFNAKLEEFGNDMLGKMFTHLGNNDIISFALGMADPNWIPDLPISKLDGVLKNNKSILSQTPVAGDIDFRESICKLLAKKNMHCSLEEIMVLSGSQQGIDIASRIMLQPGDIVFAEAPTYFLALQSFKSAGAKIIEVPVDHNGIKTEQIERLLKRYHPKCIYTNPDYQNPSSCSMSLERRKKLVDLAGRFDFIILEDAAYTGLGFEEEEIPSMYQLDKKGHVVYLGTFSKTICSGIRMGYMAAHKNIIAMASMARQNIDIHPNILSQWLIHEFMQSGSYDTHVQNLRLHYKSKMKVMLNQLIRYAPEGMEFSKPMGGYYIWCKLPEGIRASDLLVECIKDGVVFMPGKPFFQYEDGDKYIRINFTVPSVEQIENGIPIICTNIKKLMKTKIHSQNINPSSYMPVF
jgi:2-aminoadipate transaminase